MTSVQSSPPISKQQQLTKNVDVNLKQLKDALFHSDEIKERIIHFNEQKLVIVYLDSIVDKRSLEINVLDPIIDLVKFDSVTIVDNLISSLMSLIKATEMKISNNLLDVVNGGVENNSRPPFFI
ncbi:hypothetical protein AB7942_20300 [Neobacillus sp. BF23-41]|uniref:hypothetical protein n=1 Tax=Neobacillus sp. BF23-41 TaxID=3240280 RepID=UPI0034E5279A